MKATIFNIQRYSIHDGPGIRTNVFFKGCPLRCVWCHNPESHSAKPELMYYGHKCTGCGECLFCGARIFSPAGGDEGFISVDREKCVACGKCIETCIPGANKLCGYETDTREIFAEVMRDKIFYKSDGGMTLSGGEPAMQPDAALDLIKMAKKSGISTVLETSGCGESAFFGECAGYDVIFYYDLKCMDEKKHRTLTGVSNEKILKNLEMLFDTGARVVLRIPLVQSINDSDKDIDKLCRFLKENYKRYEKAEIMKYHILGSGKSKALGKEYNAPDRNAGEDDIKRWFDALHGASDKIYID